MIQITKASGRGHCDKCMHSIPKGEKQVVVWSGGWCGKRFCKKCMTYIMEELNTT